MKLPKTMTARGRTYKCKYSEFPVDDHGEISAGICDTELKELEIQIGLKPEQTLEVFIHEWLHAIWEELGLDNEKLPKILEHVLVCAISKDMVINRKELIFMLRQLPHSQKT